MSKITLPEATKFLLLVNDNPVVDKNRYERLFNNGTIVVSARSTAKAMELLGRAKYDAVLTDLRRVENGKKNNNAGIELAQSIRRTDPHIPILIYSINIDFAARQFALISGVTLITADPTELETALTRYGLIAYP